MSRGTCHQGAKCHIVTGGNDEAVDCAAGGGADLMGRQYHQQETLLVLVQYSTAVHGPDGITRHGANIEYSTLSSEG